MSKAVKSLRHELLGSISKHKATIVAFLFMTLGALLMLVAANLPHRQEYGTVLNALVATGMDPGSAVEALNSIRTGPVFTTVLWAVAGTMVSIGAVSIAWEHSQSVASEARMREGIIRAMTNPKTVKRIKRARQPEFLREMLIGRHGEILGQAIYDKSETLAKRHQLMRRDFLYNIVLTRRDANFYTARFHISFLATRLPQEPTIRFAQVKHSLDLHARYQELIDDSTNTVYRYILHSFHRGEAKDLFEVVNCTIEDQVGKKKIALNPESRTEGGQYVVRLTPSPAERNHMKEMLRHECRLEIDICTVVDRSRAEFPILLGYPVQDFRSSLDARAIDASYVDVLEFFTSNHRYRREDMKELAGEGTNGAHASGVLQDLILPDSGLTYTWR